GDEAQEEQEEEEDQDQEALVGPSITSLLGVSGACRRPPLVPMLRRCAAVALALLAVAPCATPAAASSGTDPGFVLPFPPAPDAESPPRPPGAPPVLGASRTPSPWRARAARALPDHLTRAISDGGTFLSLVGDLSPV